MSRDVPAAEGDRVRVYFDTSMAPGASPCLGVVQYRCVRVDGAFVLLDQPPPAAAWSRLRFNAGDRLVLAYHREIERVA